MNPAKTIQDYLKRKKISVRKFSSQCDLHYMTIYGILKGRPLSQLTAAKIEKYTKGEIKYEEITDLPKKRRRWNSTSRFVDSRLEMLPADWGKII